MRLGFLFRLVSRQLPIGWSRECRWTVAQVRDEDDLCSGQWGAVAGDVIEAS